MIAIDSLGNHKWTNKFLYDNSITTNRFAINERKSIFDGVKHPLQISNERLNDNQLKSLSSYSKYIYVRDTKDGYYFVFGYINNVSGLNIAKIDNEGNIHSIK